MTIIWPKIAVFSSRNNINLVIFICLLQLGCSFISPEKNYIVYPVKPGDTLFEISQRFSVSISELQEVNAIYNPKNLMAGSQIKIPYRGQGVKKNEADKNYAVSILKSGKITNKVSSGTHSTRLGEASIYVGNLLFPVKDSKASLYSRFGQRWFSFHEGLDISAPAGTPIRSAHAGQVVYSGSAISGYGNIIIIKSKGLLTVYAHNRTNHVKSGDLVAYGQTIAEVGQTGRATGPHLHFETRIKDAAGKYLAVDPLVFFR